MNERESKIHFRVKPISGWQIRPIKFAWPMMDWKNIFQSFTNKNRCYHFLEQLRYCPINHGFLGKSPALNYQRNFLVSENKIIVKDKVFFKSDISFAELFICPWAQFLEPEINKKCLIKPSVIPNYTRQIKSSTGKSTWYAHKLINLTFTKGQFLQWNYEYIIK